MIDLPDFSKAFDHENAFYLSCDPSRMSKLLAHYELYKMVMDVPGVLVECGVFKGASLARFAMFRELMGPAASKPFLGFDSFGPFPQTNFEDDVNAREKFIQSAGDQSISVDQMREVLQHKKCGDKVELIAGDICQTVPAYVEAHPELRISILNLDTDIYEPTVAILEHLYPRITTGGILILDDYGVFPGETQAVEEYFRGKSPKIRKFPFAQTPSFIIKE